MKRNCEGCAIVDKNNRLCYTLNKRGTCPCTLCLVKVMQCDISTTINTSCDQWADWFHKEWKNKWKDVPSQC